MSEEGSELVDDFRESLIGFIKEHRTAGCSECGNHNFELVGGAGHGRKKYERLIAFVDEESGQPNGEGITFFLLICNKCGDMKMIKPEIFDQWLDERK